MSTYDDVMTIETGGDVDDVGYYQALQRQINSGDVWRLQGSFGRTAMDAIEEGFVMVGKKRRTDFYGNGIPGRDDLRQGTKGTWTYVAARMGNDWADKMEEVE